jgi:hypothetical protein
VVPPVVITGGVRSLVHVMVLAAVAVLPHASLAVNVLVCVNEQPLLDTVPSIDDSVAVLHASVAVAVPRAALISDAEGLQPSVVVVPPVVITGEVRSLVHVMVLENVEVLPHPSTAVNVLVCVWVHDPVTGLSFEVTVGIPQASVALALPKAAFIADEVGLHPRVDPVPVAVIVGAVTSDVHVTILEVVEVLPQPSVAVNNLVCDLEQPLLVIAPSLCATVGVPQASVALAFPNAAAMSEPTGLHPRVSVVPVAVMVGGIRSVIQVTVLDAVEVLPQASTAVNVLVCVNVHVEVEIVPSVCDIVGVPHASVAAALPNAALIADDEGLHPSDELLYVPVNTGAVTSAVHVTVLPTLDVLPHASVAINLLNCDLLQPVLLTAPSLWVIVGIPHASVAVAVPSAAVTSDEIGLQPKFCVV